MKRRRVVKTENLERPFVLHFICENSFYQKLILKFVQFDRERGIGNGNVPEMQSNQTK